MQGKVGAGQTALITGASGGIGLELARNFAAGGFDLVLVARRKDELEKLALELAKEHGIRTRVVAMDLGNAGAAESLFAALKDAQIDVLVNNAGFATYGRFVEIDLAREMDEIQLNVVTLTALTKLFLPAMIARKRGRILNVASTAAFQPGPLMAVYYATKAFVLSFSEAIATELEKTGVTVTALCPGPTATGFAERGGVDKSKLFERGVADAKSVARAGYRACMAGRAVEVPGAVNMALITGNRFLPRSIVRQIVLRIQSTRGSKAH